MAAWFSTSKSLEGIIEQVHSDLITISKKSTAHEADMAKIDVEVTKNTKLKDVHSIFELKKGDQIRVEYKEESAGRKVAMEVAKLKPTEGASSPQSKIQ